MNNKEKLISYLKENTDLLNNLIESELKDDEIQFAIDYIEKLNTISKHNITKIGHTENGDFYLTCETGITYLK